MRKISSLIVCALLVLAAVPAVAVDPTDSRLAGPLVNEPIVGTSVSEDATVAGCNYSCGCHPCRRPLITTASTPSLLELMLGPVDGGTYYECKPEHYDPPCRKISKGFGASDAVVLSVETEVTNYRELKAAVDTVALLTPISIPTSLSSPTEACANTHGGSGCCKVVLTMDEVTGTTYYIKCG